MESNVYNNQKPMESNQNNGSIKMQCSVMNGLLVYCVVMVFEVSYVLGVLFLHFSHKQQIQYQKCM